MFIHWITDLTMAHAALILALALVIDRILGDPPGLYRIVFHPVALIGQLIDVGERHLRRPGKQEILAGTVLVIGVTLLAAVVGTLIERLLVAVPFGWLLEALIASTLFAWRGLADHAVAVADGLGRSLAEGRAAVARIVGRDPESLDQAGVARATIESIAENFSDGVVAPAFWFLLFGLPGLCAYKAINTLDSMIGHKTPQYLHFGRVAARLDDFVNWLPARLAGALLVLAARFTRGANAKAAWQVMRRDAHKHRSPNAGWQEAAVAGALGFALAGPRRYPNETVEDAWMGNGSADLSAGDIRDSLRLYHCACGLLTIAVAGLWLVLAAS